MPAPRLKHGIVRGIAEGLSGTFTPMIVDKLRELALQTGIPTAGPLLMYMNLVDLATLLAMYLAITFWNWEYRIGYLLGVFLLWHAGLMNDFWSFVEYFVVPMLIIVYHALKGRFTL